LFDRLNVNVTSRLDARVPQHTLSDGPAAHIRYASMCGTGLVELNKYKEAIGPLDEAIQVAAKTRNVAYPSIAVNARIEALSGIGQNDQALHLLLMRCERQPLSTWPVISAAPKPSHQRQEPCGAVTRVQAG
jgi:hypothetical protein